MTNETREMDPKHRQIAAMGRKMIDMSSNMDGTDDNTLMMANALSRLGDTLVNFGADFGPKTMADVVKITGMSEPVIKALINKTKADPAAAESVNEGLGDMADMAERDHEVQMARAELYKIAKYAISLHDMLKGVSEAEGIEGWMQSKITKAADYIGSVYHTMDYDMASEPKAPVVKMGAEESRKYKDSLSAKLAEKKDSPGIAAMKKAGNAKADAEAKERSKKKTNERSLTKGEEGKKEKYVKGMKKAKGDFKKRYGKDAEAVMYATATKMAKKK